MEVRGRSPEGGQNDREVKKLKVINKSKKLEKDYLTVESKAKLIKQLEKNLKKVKNPNGVATNLETE